MTTQVAAAILNVNVTASRAEIDAAFRLKARMSHPDRFAGAPASDIRAATAEFVRITQAREAMLAHLRAGSPSGSPWVSHPSGGTQSSQPTREQQERDERARQDQADRARQRRLHDERLRADLRREDAVREQWKRDNPPRRSTAPPPVGFEEFVRLREERAWLPYPNDSGSRGPVHTRDAPRLHRRSPGVATIAFGLSAVVVIAAITWVSLRDPIQGALPSTALLAPSEAPMTSSTVDISASVVQGDVEGDSSSLCAIGGLGCFTWALTSSVTCPAAEVTVGISDSQSGDPLRTDVRTVVLAEDVPQPFVEERASSAEAVAWITSIVC